MKPSLSLAAALVTAVLAAGCAGVDDASTETTRPPAPTVTVTETAAAEPVALDETDEPTRERRSKPKAKPKPAPKPRTYTVTRVVDGDTVELGNGQQVRVVGIDTPEQGDCGYEAASNHMADLVLFKKVILTLSDEDTDRYGRLLRYVDVGDIDAGLNQIRSGFAIARYDSRDGYGEHAREAVYITADRQMTQFKCERPAPVAQPAPQGSGCHPGYSPCLPVVADLNCDDVNGPITVLGDDPHQFDADGDGTGCDS